MEAKFWEIFFYLLIDDKIHPLINQHHLYILYYLIIFLMEVFQLPTAAIQAVKKAEYWCWKAAGTKDDIDNFLDKVEDAIEKTEEGSDIL